jgi:hypothetical protein
MPCINESLRRQCVVDECFKKLYKYCMSDKVSIYMYMCELRFVSMNHGHNGATNSDVEEAIYLSTPVSPADKVLLLRKSLYGLRQSLAASTRRLTSG